MTGAAVLLCRSRRTRRDTRDFASRLGLTVVTLPDDHDKLLRHLNQLLAS
jgi:hypothetical protein